MRSNILIYIYIYKPVGLRLRSSFHNKLEFNFFIIKSFIGQSNGMNNNGPRLGPTFVVPRTYWAASDCHPTARGHLRASHAKISACSEKMKTIHWCR